MHLWISFTSNAAVLIVDVAIQPEVRFIAKQNSLMKIGNNGNLVLGSFDESTPCLMIILMNCQTKLRINHLTAVKSVAILEKFIHGALAPREEPLQDSNSTGLLLQDRGTVTLKFHQDQDAPDIVFFFSSFEMWTAVHDQESVSAHRKDYGTIIVFLLPSRRGQSFMIRSLRVLGESTTGLLKLL
ncbi:alpha-2 adrenergic receptor [Trichonephila clavipes]|nr:alpha-2 adrenergic receptor [Trichonephila clavipes]